MSQTLRTTVGEEVPGTRVTVQHPGEVEATESSAQPTRSRASRLTNDSGSPSVGASLRILPQKRKRGSQDT